MGGAYLAARIATFLPIHMNLYVFAYDKSARIKLLIHLNAYLSV